MLNFTTTRTHVDATIVIFFTTLTMSICSIGNKPVNHRFVSNHYPFLTFFPNLEQHPQIPGSGGWDSKIRRWRRAPTSTTLRRSEGMCFMLCSTTATTSALSSSRSSSRASTPATGNPTSFRRLYARHGRTPGVVESSAAHLNYSAFQETETKTMSWWKPH